MYFHQKYVVDGIINCLQEEKYQDVTVICQNGTFQSNSLILASIFPVMKTLLSSVHHEDEPLVISIPDMETLELETLFHGLYHQTPTIRMGPALKQLLYPSIKSKILNADDYDDEDSMLIKHYDSILSTKEINLKDADLKNVEISDHTYNSYNMENDKVVKDKDVLEESQYKDEFIDTDSTSNVVTLKIARKTEVPDIDDSDILRKCVGNEYVYQCKSCDYTSKRRTDVKRHMGSRVCDPQGPYKNRKSSRPSKCLQCDFTTRDTDNLISHLMSAHRIFAKIVSREKKHGWNGKIQYYCRECDFQTRRNDEMKIHMERIHGKGVSVTCDVCGILFAGETILKKHKLIHESEKRTKCDKCGKVYHISNLESHYCKSAENGFTKQCNICKKTFCSVDYLEEHKKKTHELPVFKKFCNICGKGFTSTSSLNGHLGTHGEKIPCQQCGKLVNPTKMSQHNQYHHKPREVKCEICGAGFVAKPNLDRHMMNVHLKLRPYKCRYGLGCEFAYNDTSNRDAHERKKHGKIFTTSKEEKIKAILALKHVGEVT